ncbi:MAG: T9SS type A sorting domain-containing protein [Balneola sp.]
MKKLILFFFFIGLGASLSAQNLFVTSTSPTHGAENVDQDSIKITFNKKIAFDDSSFTEGLPIPFLILPFDSIQITQLRLSEDSLSMIIDGNLADNTDFTFIVLDAHAQDGDKLGAPYLFRFTTNPTAGQFVVNGKITEEEMSKLKANSSADHLGGLTVILSEETLDIGLDFEGTEDEPNEEDEHDPLDASHIAFVNPETGEYSIDGIREGDFFAFGLNIFSIEQDNEGFPDLYIHDPNEDFSLDTIKVNSTDVPTDTLNNIDLRKLLFEPFTFGEAYERTSSLNFSGDVEAKAGIAEIPLVFDSFDDSQPKQLFKGIPVTASLDDHQNPFFDPENGKSIIWSMFFYDTVKDSVHLVGISPFGAQIIETVGAGDLDIPVSISTVNSLPENMIDSDSAAAIAEMNGGAEFRQEASNSTFASVEFVAAQAYWEYPLDNTTSAPTHWRVEYEAQNFDFDFKQTNDHEGFGEDSLVFYIDVLTGDILYKAGNKIENGPSFNVVSSSPADGDVAVSSDTSTISITFDAPVKLNEYGFFEDGLEIIPFPLDSINIIDFSLSDVGRTLNFKVIHSPETDYTWLVSKAKNTAGGVLERPYIFNYTTSASSVSQSVSGSVNTNTDSPTKSVENEYDGVMVALFTSNPFVDNENDSEPDGPGFTIAKATLADTTTGTYTLNGVRDGVYFPLSINLIEDGFDETPSAIGIYDPDSDGSLNSITVSGGNLTDIDIQFKAFEPITASTAVSLANSVAAELDSGLELYFMFTEEDLIEYDDFNDNLHQKKGLQKYSFSHFKVDDEIATPTGTGEEWGLLYYNSTTETALAFGVNPFGVGFVDTLDTAEFLEDFELEGATFDDLSPLPSFFFDSDSAAIVAEENGGSDFRQGDAEFLYVEYVAINAPTLLPEGITADGGVWGVIYSKESFNQQTFNYEYIGFEVFMDFEDGTFLGSNIDQDEPITALDGRAAADTLATNIYDDNKLYFIDAVGNIFSDPELDQQKKALKNDEENSDLLEGKFFFIEYRFYSEINDTETPIFVDASGEAYFSGNSFDIIPEGVTYTDLESISETIIDSDSAVAIANAAGAAAFRDNLGADFDLVRLDIQVQAGNRFWLHPEGVDSSLVTWTVRFLRTSRHKTTEEYELESAEYLINAETGAVIDSMVITSNEEDDLISDIPDETSLGQNYPNPFNPSTTIPFSLKEAANVEITIYNMLGQKVTSLVNEKFAAGNHFATWDASSLASGMYIYRLKAGNVVKTKKLMLIK